MEPCYEYLGCQEHSCIAYGRKDGEPCWDLQGTSCNHDAIRILRAKMSGLKKEACARSGCIYFKMAKDRDHFLGKTSVKPDQ